MFPRAIHPVPANRNQSDAYSQARIVKERLVRWGRGEYRELWDEATKLSRFQPRKKKKGVEETEPSQEEQNSRRATRLAQDGQFTRALQALTSAGLVQDKRAALNTLRDK